MVIRKTTKRNRYQSYYLVVGAGRSQQKVEFLFNYGILGFPIGEKDGFPFCGIFADEGNGIADNVDSYATSESVAQA